MPDALICYTKSCNVTGTESKGTTNSYIGTIKINPGSRIVIYYDNIFNEIGKTNIINDTSLQPIVSLYQNASHNGIPLFGSLRIDNIKCCECIDIAPPPEPEPEPEPNQSLSQSLNQSQSLSLNQGRA